VTKQLSIEVGDLGMLNTKNIRTKRLWQKLSPKLYGPFNVLKRIGSTAYKLEIWPQWKIHPVFHVFLLESDPALNRPNREQRSRDPANIERDLKCEVEKFIKSKIISYTRKVSGRNKQRKELRYFVKWKGCAEDENTWAQLEGRKNVQEQVERFHRENPEMLGPGEVESHTNVFHQWTSKRHWFLPLQ